MSYSIKIEHVSKKYLIGQATHSNYATLRDTLTHSASAFFRNLTKGPFSKKQDSEILWALRDISFQAAPGETIGVVGKNGAGKSTLLKVLSRITEPTLGSVRLRGRLASLLEVGTGFHPELTGRENIFLNGALLGMRKHEIQRKFDEIVEFAQVEKFIDTPVKRYSSGMYIRLAFSVAAHLEPEVLVLDEVLAVGDVAFQKKCTQFMRDVGSRDRTVLLVSHNLHLIRSLCTRLIVLDQGRLIQDGPVEQVLPSFIKLLQPGGDVGRADLKNRAAYCTGELRIEKFDFFNQKNEPSWKFSSDEMGYCEVEYFVQKPIKGLSVALFIANPLTEDVITTIKEKITHETVLEGTRNKVRLEFPRLALRPGDYSVQICLMNEEGHLYYDRVGREADIPFLSITSSEVDPQKRIGYFTLPAFVREG